MNCQKFEQLAVDLVHGRLMEVDVRADAVAHVEECGVCAARLHDEEALTRGLGLLATRMDALLASPDLESKLREAFRQRKVVVPIATTSTNVNYWWAAVAAVLLVVMTAAAMWWRSSAPEQAAAEKPAQPQQVEVAHGPTERATPNEVKHPAGNETAKSQPQLSKSLRRNAPLRRAAETQLANHVSNEIATDFMPLGDLSLASLQDGGQIVRVKLRRSALARFGLPVNMDRYNENVKADVLVGSDGLAHAIRFVQ